MAAGKEIKRLRGKEVTAAKAARLIGVGVDRLRKWEERDSNPNDTGDIAKVEAYFGVKLEQIAEIKAFDFVEFPRENEQVFVNRNMPGFVPAERLIQALEEQNAFLRRNFEISLNSIAEGQQQAGNQIKALSWFSALVANAGDEKKAEMAMQEIGNKIASYEGIAGEDDSLKKEDKGHTSGKEK